MKRDCPKDQRHVAWKVSFGRDTLKDDYVCYLSFLISDLNFDPPREPSETLLVEIKTVRV